MGKELEKKKIEDQVDEGVNDTEDQVEGEDQDDEGTEHESFSPITSQEELNRIISERVRRAERSTERKLRDSIREEVRSSLEEDANRKNDEDKGEFEKLYKEAQEKIRKMEEAAEKAELSRLKIELLEEAGLPASAAKRITGETREEIEADIKDFLADHPTVKRAPKETGSSGPGVKKTKKEKVVGGVDYSDTSIWGLPPLAKK